MYPHAPQGTSFSDPNQAGLQLATGIVNAVGAGIEQARQQQAYQQPVYQPQAYQQPVYQPQAYQQPAYQPQAYQQPAYQPQA